MSKKYDRVLFDIDCTITELDAIMSLMSEALSKPKRGVHDAATFSLASTFDVTEEVAQDFWTKYEQTICTTAVLAEERFETMKKNYLHNDTKIYMVTSRTDAHYQETYDWLIDNGIAFDELHCTSHQTKLDIIRDKDIQAVFEDKPGFFKELHQEGLFDEVDTYCVDYPYNQEVPTKYRLDRVTGEKIVLAMKKVTLK